MENSTLFRGTQKMPRDIKRFRMSANLYYQKRAMPILGFASLWIQNNSRICEGGNPKKTALDIQKALKVLQIPPKLVTSKTMSALFIKSRQQ
ncbi:MAG: hypothetical protein COU81_00340 [Candidatus Portnoybacteria bacterium CG10_big_fil_rev_8_21_14_0_10_36_7]|uniref:Uncharacterized protein n=1 Tax=Candidatus Portnoybacteria bacterium CG10_big_fil_rev_8_21_14_0_10_36_7 TaxID=1974812 RepID=A0A2M8KF10_9BACT|nr:MAG: hypothetical protein COU81_00340 [Candidatus Portnoybacteria bacterium CG10_big_fil_rev_8_21_14_0_10_36_7]